MLNSCNHLDNLKVIIQYYEYLSSDIFKIIKIDLDNVNLTLWGRGVLWHYIENAADILARLFKTGSHTSGKQDSGQALATVSILMRFQLEMTRNSESSRVENMLKAN